MKKCFKCEIEKPVDQFYRHPQMSDGRLNKCKDCAKRDVQMNRLDKIERYRKYDRKRGNRQSIEYLRTYRKNNASKYAAHSAVNNAVRSGKLHRSESCESCGSTDRWIHGHHDDYDKPLNVMWLCPVCHKQRHKELEQMK